MGVVIVHTSMQPSPGLVWGGGLGGITGKDDELSKEYEPVLAYRKLLTTNVS
jgi:hypothetical protein